MEKIFLDTVAWIALLNSNDRLHKQAWRMMETLRQQKTQLITTEFVLLEVADALSAPAIRAQTVAFIEGLRHLPILQIIPAKQAVLDNGWDLYRRRPDKDWGLTDCTSFVVMTQEKITQAFTSDHHFEQAGFINLLSHK
jgi:uncharacterized protein